MLFYAFDFLFFFLPLVLLGYFLFASRLGRRSAIIFLVFASLLFYGCWNAKYLLFLIPSIAVNYFLGRWLQKHQSKPLLTLGVLANLGFLGYFKYTNFFLDIVDGLASTSWQIESIVLPIAISFYTFQQIAWLVDSFSQKIDTRTEGFWRYALFVSFFPQLIAGPIVHHSEMMPQFSRDSTFRFRWTSFTVGLSIFIIGLTKKVVLADGMAAIATPAFSSAASGSVAFVDAWMAAIGFTLQVYFDFSGYSDMAIGLARMFNIRLPVNFNSPLKSPSIIEFWTKWHMTMTRFFQAYVHVPLSIFFFRRQMKLGFKGNLSMHITTFITLLAIGFWHGANWTFIVFGLMHGVMVVTNHLWKSFRKKHKIAALPRIAGVSLTLFTFILTCVTYRAENLDVAWSMYGSMFAPVTLAGEIFVSDLYQNIIITLIASITALFLPNTQQLMQRYNPVINMEFVEKIHTKRFLKKLLWRPNYAWLVTLAIMWVWSLYTLLDANKVQEFIYFQF